MVQAPTQPLSLEAFLAQPETKPAREYSDGAIAQKPMPQGEHSTLQGDLVSVLNASLKPTKIGRAYPELRCTFGGRSLVPDIAVFQWGRIPRRADGRVENAFKIAPDWAIEILSPGQSQTQILRNLSHCFAHGTQMAWLLDPEEACLLVYNTEPALRVFEADATPLPVPDFAAAVQLTAGEIFGWLTT